MCGVVGMLVTGAASESELSLFKGLLLVDQIRGYHATGVAKVNTRTNTVAIYKKAMDATDFLASQEAKDFLDNDKVQIYMGHNRFATMGNKGADENAHPFQHEHITMVHNGGVDPFGLELLEGLHEVAVDSHMVCMTIAKHGIKKAVEEHLVGAFALVWWDAKERSLNFIRNQERPLYMGITTGGALVWASEKGMLDVYLDRSSKAANSYRVAPQMLDTNKLYKFVFNEQGHRLGTMPTCVDMEFLEFEYPKQTAAASQWWGGQNDTYHGTSQSSSNVTSIGSARKDAKQDTVAFDNMTRVNKCLIDQKLGIRWRSLLTVDVVRLEPYATDRKYGIVYGTCRDTQETISAWGLDMDEMRDVRVIRGNVNNAYNLKVHGEPTLTITIDCVGVSCHDPKYSAQTSGSIATNTKPKPKGSSSTTSRGDVVHNGQKVEDTKITVAKIMEMRDNKKAAESKKPQGVHSVRFPLKVHGHTFQTSSEFREYVSKGCSNCNNIPTAYDSRNVDITIYQNGGMSSSLDTCEFICGACEGSNK